MAVTSGFFDAQLVDDEYDRVYNSDDFGSMFDGIISDGIFGSIGDKLKVVASSQFTINVKTGKAWFNRTWINNSAILPLTLDNPPSPQSRIDAIVIDVNKDVSTRLNSIKIVKGVASTNPTRPNLINTSTHKQYALAYIRVKAGATSITNSDITDIRGTSECPFVLPVNPSITADELMTQWANRFDELYVEMGEQMDTAVQAAIDAIEAAGSQAVVDGAISTPKLQNGAVTRAKLNSDALYSPIVVMRDSQYYISSSDCGKTFRVDQETQFVIDSQTSQDLPSGFEVAIINYGDDTNNVTIFFDGVPVCATGARYTSSAHPTIRITDGYTMIAIKKITAEDTWLVTGSVEVVS